MNEFESQKIQSKRDKKVKEKILDQLDNIRLYSIYNKGGIFKNLFIPRKLKV